MTVQTQRRVFAAVAGWLLMGVASLAPAEEFLVGREHSQLHVPHALLFRCPLSNGANQLPPNPGSASRNCNPQVSHRRVQLGKAIRLVVLHPTTDETHQRPTKFGNERDSSLAGQHRIQASGKVLPSYGDRDYPRVD
ncbi:MAG: hypothetical protein ABI939_03230 [Anaerolineaceae bacterium]